MTKDGFYKGVTNLTNFSDSRAACLFSQLPIPPSSNNQYFLARRGKKTYHIPSDELKAYKQAMREYPLIYQTYFQLNKHKIKGWIQEGKPLEIRAAFFFKRERLLTLKNAPKRLDVSNRLKALHDSLCQLLEIDDCWFFQVYAEKVVCQENDNEQVCVEIKSII